MKSVALDSSTKGMTADPKRLLVLGLGNDILSDDAVGLHLAREIRLHLADPGDTQIQELSEMGLSLLDYIVGFDELMLIDAIQTGQAQPGFLHKFEGEQLQALSSRSPHCFGIAEVLAFGRELGLAVPERVRVLAVEVDDLFTVGTELTSAVRLALPRLVQEVLRLVEGAIAR